MHGRIVQRMIEAVTHYQSGPLNIPDLALTAGLSRWHMARVFRAQTGEAPSDFLRRIHLERAAHRLLNSFICIAEIGKEASYKNSPSFTRGFIKAFGMTPSAFRASSLSDWRLPSAAEIHWQPHPEFAAYSPVDLQKDGADVEILGADAFSFGAHRVHGSYHKAHLRWKELFANELKDRVLPHGTRFLTLYNDSPENVPADELRIDLCVVRPDGRIEPGLKPRVMPAGSYVRTKELLCAKPASMAWCPMLRHWVPKSGSRPKNVPSFEESFVCPAASEQFPMRLYVGLEIDLGSQ
ncbi:MAG: AraC family transcriptional regulator [Fimbriimonadaceae bacterium]|nr:AraC family transcriptional regulator [Fimbriimonadaceae bacterium]